MKNFMKDRILSFAFVALLLALSTIAAQAQQPTKVARIGFLDPSTAAASEVLVDAFRQELSKLGWTEGKNIVIEYRFAEQKMIASLSLQGTWFVLRSI